MSVKVALLTHDEQTLHTRALAVVTMERMRESRKFSMETVRQINEEFVQACEPFSETYAAEEVICRLLEVINEQRTDAEDLRKEREA